MGTAKPDETASPYKKLKPHPTDPKKVVMKDANGKAVTKPKPEGFDEYWNSKH